MMGSGRKRDKTQWECRDPSAAARKRREPPVGMTEFGLGAVALRRHGSAAPGGQSGIRLGEEGFLARGGLGMTGLVCCPLKVQEAWERNS